MSPHVDAYPDLERELNFHPVTEPPRTLTAEQVRTYNERGTLFPLEVYSAAEMAEIRAYFNDLMAKAQAKGWNSYSINGWQCHCAGIYDLIVEPRVLDYVRDIVGDDIICWGAHFFCKEPGDPKRVSWHQDASYWPFTHSRTVTVWLAIDDVDEENGAMKVVPGSHRHGQIAYEHSQEDEGNVLNQTVHTADEFGEPVSVNLKAGQIQLHSDLLLHGSEPNLSNRRRCGLTMRYVPPSTQAYRGWQKNAIICRGSDPNGHWPHNPRPEGEQIPDPPPNYN